MTRLDAAFEELLHIGIMERLKQLSIKGKPGWVSQCPIANYLKLYLGTTSVGVGAIIASADDEDCTMPHRVRDFIRAFDNYEYPELAEDGYYIPRTAS